jgi:hypothetical protein
MTELDPTLEIDLPPDEDYIIENNALDKAQRRARIFGFFVPLAFTFGLAAGFLLWGRQPETPPAAAPTRPTTSSSTISRAH